MAFICDDALGTTNGSSLVINKQTKGLQLPLAVDGLATIRAKGIVGKDPNDGSIMDSFNPGSSLNKGQGRKDIISHTNHISCGSQVSFQDAGIRGTNEASIGSTINKGTTGWGMSDIIDLVDHSGIGSAIGDTIDGDGISGRRS